MYSPLASGLPDPEFQADFYQDVPSKRLIAWVIDVAITLVLTLLFSVVTLPISLFFFPLWFVVIGFAYRVLSISRWSATLGMRFVSIELRLNDGGRFDLPSAIMHTFLYSVFSSFFLPQVVSIFLAITNPRGQMLQDLIMGSAAINRAARD